MVDLYMMETTIELIWSVNQPPILPKWSVDNWLKPTASIFHK